MGEKLAASHNVFPLVYLTEDDLLPYEQAFEKLMENTKTKVTFNYNKQYFLIQGRSQGTCETVGDQIVKKFLPVLNAMLAEDPFKSTYNSMERETPIPEPDSPATPLSANSTGTSHSNLTSPNLVRLSGRPPSLADTTRAKSPTPPGTPAAPSPAPSQGPAQYYRGETESEGESEEEEEFSGQFVFAKNIARPEDVLTGPPLSNKQQTNYLKAVEDATGTECALIPKSNIINITGYSQEAIGDATARFKQLQSLYKRRNKKTAPVPCIHPNPNDKRPFLLFFAPMEQYRHRNMVFMAPEIPRPLYTLLPVFMDPRTGKPIKPTDHDVAVASPSPSLRQPPRSSPPRGYDPPSRAQQSNRPSPPSAQARQAAPPPTQSSMPESSWGNQVVIQPQRQTAITPEAEHWKNRQQIVPTQRQASSSAVQDNFPSLPTTQAKKPSVQPPGKAMQRRVMRISSQKAPPPSPSSPSNVQSMCREYNFHNVKTALTEGLEHVRGLRGDIRLGAKLGKVLWNNVSPEVQKKLWKFEDIKDLAMRETKVMPVFNNVTTKDGNVIDTIYRQFPDNYSKTACYEIHAMARNQPTLEYQPIIMTVNPGAVGLQKVILRQDRVTEIDWVSLDRKFDFQMYLNVELLGRTDVKPYSTFLKKLSINTHTCQMTYEDVPNFLKVTNVFYKETTKHRLHFPFVVEISRTERLPLIPQPSMGFGVDKILADTGNGDSWYDCEVFYTSHYEFFKRNLDLSVGKLASWTLNDVLGGDILVEYIQCMVLITENLQDSFPP